MAVPRGRTAYRTNDAKRSQFYANGWHYNFAQLAVEHCQQLWDGSNEDLKTFWQYVYAESARLSYVFGAYPEPEECEDLRATPSKTFELAKEKIVLQNDADMSVRVARPPERMHSLTMPGSHNDTSDLADYRASRKLQDFYLYYGRWYGRNGNLPREKYIFPIDKEELARLDILHKFFLVVRKNHLFSASLDVEQPLRILDLGTGTGIWAIELSEKYPHMHVQGLDFNMIQPNMIPRTMAPPKPFDVEGSWDTVDLDWDFMHVRTLFG
ncbi:hypothetical protein FBEOM_13507, partial [Fusarium beomiforme]